MIEKLKDIITMLYERRTQLDKDLIKINLVINALEKEIEHATSGNN